MLMDFYARGREKGGFEKGVETGLQRILSSPQFVFRFERDPARARDGAYALSDSELAARLAFFLWSSIPDDELLELASRNRLSRPAVLEQQVQRMLADPKAAALTKNFAGQWLYLRNLAIKFPSTYDFPDFDDNLRDSFRRETELLFEHIVRNDLSVLELLTADYTFVDERLAKHYGIPGVYGSEFRKVAVTDPRRQGLLGHGSILLVTSNPNRTSPVNRGVWVLKNILGRRRAGAAAREHSVARGSRRRRRFRLAVGARAHGAAPLETVLRGLPQDHGSHRPRDGEFRRHRPVAHGRQRHADRYGGQPRRRHVDRRSRRAAGRAAEVRRANRAQRGREALDLRRRPRHRILRPARDSADRARRGAVRVPVFIARDGRRHERRVLDARHREHGRRHGDGRARRNYGSV